MSLPPMDMAMQYVHNAINQGLARHHTQEHSPSLWLGEGRLRNPTIPPKYWVMPTLSTDP